MQWNHCWAWMIIGCLMVAGPQPGRAADEAADVRVMSFNIRYGTASDGENHWNRRKSWLVETIRTFAPDLL